MRSHKLNKSKKLHENQYIDILDIKGSKYDQNSPGRFNKGAYLVIF